MGRRNIKIILAPFAAIVWPRKIDRTKAKVECSAAALIFGYCDRSVTFPVLVFGDRRNCSFNCAFCADLRRLCLLASLGTVFRWDRCTIELPRIVLPLIDAIGTSPIRLDIFLILKIGSLNINSPLIALRKITGDWGLFAGRGVASHKRRYAFDQRQENGGRVMKRLFLLGVIALLAIAAAGRAMAADAFGAWTNGLPTAWVEGPTCDPYVDFNCTPSKAVMALKSGVNGPCDPYVNYKCLDTYLGDNPAVPLFPLLPTRMG